MRGIEFQKPEFSRNRGWWYKWSVCGFALLLTSAGIWVAAAHGQVATPTFFSSAPVVLDPTGESDATFTARNPAAMYAQDFGEDRVGVGLISSTKRFKGKHSEDPNSRRDESFSGGFVGFRATKKIVKVDGLDTELRIGIAGEGVTIETDDFAVRDFQSKSTNASIAVNFGPLSYGTGIVQFERYARTTDGTDIKTDEIVKGTLTGFTLILPPFENVVFLYGQAEGIDKLTFRQPGVTSKSEADRKVTLRGFGGFIFNDDEDVIFKFERYLVDKGPFRVEGQPSFGLLSQVTVFSLGFEFGEDSGIAFSHQIHAIDHRPTGITAFARIYQIGLKLGDTEFSFHGEIVEGREEDSGDKMNIETAAFSISVPFGDEN